LSLAPKLIGKRLTRLDAIAKPHFSSRRRGGALRPFHAPAALIRGRAPKARGTSMAAEVETEKEVVTHRKGYEGFVFLMKWGAIVCVITALIVILLIRE
jgi:hypothetical protein